MFKDLLEEITVGNQFSNPWVKYSWDYDLFLRIVIFPFEKPQIFFPDNYPCSMIWVLR